MNETPRIYVASLSDYNSGRLHGAWINADTDEDTIAEEIQTMLARSKEPIAEEYAIHDSEGFGGISIDENESLEDVCAIAEGIEEHGAAFLAAYGNFFDATEALKACEECYCGEWNSLEEWAEEYMESTGGLETMPENLRYYFDFESFARDCEMGGDIWSDTDECGKLHVFHNR